MLNDQEIEQLFSTLRNKHGDSEPPEGYYEEFFQPETLRDLSDHFDISVDTLRTLSKSDLWLLEIEFFVSDETPLLFEEQQRFDEIEKAGGIIPYLKQRQEKRKARKETPSSPFLPKQRYR